MAYDSFLLRQRQGEWNAEIFGTRLTDYGSHEGGLFPVGGELWQKSDMVVDKLGRVHIIQLQPDRTLMYFRRNVPHGGWITSEVYQYPGYKSGSHPDLELDFFNNPVIAFQDVNKSNLMIARPQFNPEKIFLPTVSQ